MNGPGLIVAAVSYGALLFLLAWRVERAPERAARLRRWAYPFALAVYCTSWTFYGAVGSAYDQGWSYLPIYLGPVLVYALGTPFLARLVTETRLEGATTVSDFIGARHNRSPMVAALVSLIALIGIVPYLALQLRSIGTSYARIAGVADPLLVPAASGALLAVFALLFGTRRFDRASRNDGLLVAVAVESVVKLIAFAAVGVFAVALLAGASDAAATAGRAALAQRFDPAAIDADFFVVTLLSAAAILCLPRQFYIGVIEAEDATDPVRARGPFIAYLAITTLLVLPITLAGLTLAGSGAAGDRLVIDLPIAAGQESLAVLVFIGGFSAATAMVVVETIALSTMVSNDLVAPVLLRRGWGDVRDMGAVMLRVRRATIVALMTIAVLFVQLLPRAAALASIGLVAFAAVAQIAPALILSARRGGRNPTAAAAGLATGLGIWSYTLLLPIVAPVSWLDRLRGTLFDPHALFGIDGLGAIAHGTVWSLGANMAVHALVAAQRLGRPRISIAFADAVAPAHDRRALVDLVARFVGEEPARAALGTAGGPIDQPTAREAERMMARVIGAASARSLIASALSGAQLSVNDVTRMLDAGGQSLQFSRDLLAATLENIDPGVSVVDRDLNLIAWNSRYLDMFDYPPGMVRVGAPVADLIRHNALRGECGPGEVDAHVERRLAHMRRGLQHSFERNRPGGRVLKTVGGPMPGGGYVMCFTDVTAEAEARAELEASRAELEGRVADRTAALSSANRALIQATADKTRFLAAASHDLLQPLHAARLFAGALERGIDERGRPLLDRIDRSIASADALLRTLLDISKLDAGGITAERERFALRPMLADLVDSFAPLAAEKGLRLRLARGDAWVDSDPVLLRSIIQNFLSNAVRYTHDGGVLIGAQRRGTMVRIAVYDTGPGIAPDEQDRIFREFERIAPRDEAGAGLGLAIVERTARLIGAPISLRSEPGRGSRFAITLPIAATSSPPAPLATTPPVGAATPTGALTVLVVDDEPAVAEAMAAWLTALGHDARAFTDAHSARDAVEHGGLTPDVALLDFDLGDTIDGVDLAMVVRRMVPTAHVALVTADQSSAGIRRGADLNLTRLAKPVDPTRLAAWIAQATPVTTP